MDEESSVNVLDKEDSERHADPSDSGSSKDLVDHSVSLDKPTEENMEEVEDEEIDVENVDEEPVEGNSVGTDPVDESLKNEKPAEEARMEEGPSELHPVGEAEINEEDDDEQPPILEEQHMENEEGEIGDEQLENEQLENLEEERASENQEDEDEFEDLEEQFREMDSVSCSEEDEAEHEEEAQASNRNEINVENDKQSEANSEVNSIEESENSKQSGEKWIEYLRKYARAIQPSMCDDLFHQQRKAEKTILEFLIQPEMIVLIDDGEFGPRFARVLVCYEDMLKVLYMDNPEDEESDWVDCEKMITDDEVIEECIEIFPLTEEDVQRIFQPKHCEMTREQLLSGKKVHEFIEPGMWLEIQLEMSPQITTYACVLKNYGGILEVGYSKHRRFIHMFDPMCHYFGWGLDQMPEEFDDHQYVIYNSWCTNVDYDQARDNEVPRALLYNNVVRKHYLEVGDLLAVALPENHNIYYSHVTQIHNSHYFSVNCGLNTKDFGCQNFGPININSPRIFPAKYFENTGIELEPPAGIRKMKNSQQFSWEVYENLFSRDGEYVEECGTGIVEEECKISTFKYVEFLKIDGQKCHFFAAEICRSQKGLLWIRPHFTNGLIVVHVKDPRVFRVGTSVDYGLPIYFETPIERMPIAGQEKWSNCPSTAMERKTIFMPKYLLDGSSFVPRLYINRNCSIGKYLDAKTFAALPYFIEAGNLEGVLKLVFKYIMNSVISSKRAIVTHLFQKSIDFEKLVTVMNVKYRYSIKEPTTTIRVAACESVAEFPSFLRIVLLALFACPNLFGFEKTDEKNCPYECYSEAKRREELRLLDVAQNEREKLLRIEEDEEGKEELEDEDEEEFEDLELVEHDENLVRRFVEESESRSKGPSSPKKRRILDPVGADELREMMDVDEVLENEASTSDEGKKKIDEICDSHERSFELRMESAGNSMKQSLLTPCAPPILLKQKPTASTPKKSLDQVSLLKSIMQKNQKDVLQNTPTTTTTSTTVYNKPLVVSAVKPNEEKEVSKDQPSTSTPGVPQGEQRVPIATPVTWERNIPSRPVPMMPSNNLFSDLAARQAAYMYQMAMMQREFEARTRPMLMMSAPTGVEREQEPSTSRPTVSRVRTSSPDASQPSTSSGIRSSVAFLPTIQTDRLANVQAQPSPAFSNCSSSSSSKVSEEKRVVMIGKPTLEEVKKWDNTVLTDYLRRNFLNIGSEPIKTLNQLQISGAQLLEMNEEDCVVSCGTSEAGSRLYRFIRWILDP